MHTSEVLEKNSIGQSELNSNIIDDYLQALHQIQALNGLTPATTLVNGVTSNTVSMPPTQQAHSVLTAASNPAAAASGLPASAQLNSPAANPYQGAGLSSATTATAQPASAVNLLALQQLLASNAAGSPAAAQMALANGAQGKHLLLLSKYCL